MAALAAIVDHDHARVLNELLQEGIQLRQQLERQRQQLERQRHQLHHQELLIAELQIKGTTKSGTLLSWRSPSHRLTTMCRWAE